MPALAFGVIYSVFKELPLEGRTGPRNWRTSFLELTPTRLPCPATTGGEQVLRASVSNACTFVQAERPSYGRPSGVSTRSDAFVCRSGPFFQLFEPPSGPSYTTRIRAHFFRPT